MLIEAKVSRRAQEFAWLELIWQPSLVNVTRGGQSFKRASSCIQSYPAKSERKAPGARGHTVVGPVGPNDTT
jgi:hypothetical protein